MNHITNNVIDHSMDITSHSVTEMVYAKLLSEPVFDIMTTAETYKSFDMSSLAEVDINRLTNTD